MKTKTYYLLTLVAISVISAIYEAMVYWHDLVASNNILFIGQLLFVVLLVMWVDTDSKDQAKIYRPFEFGYLVFLFWVPYLPYYLWRTRGTRGVIVLSGLIGLFFLGYMAQWIIYFVR